MKLIDLSGERERKKKEAEEREPSLNMVQFEDGSDITALIMPTVDGDIAFITDPGNRRGILLTPEQATEIALALLRSATLIECGVLNDLMESPPDSEKT